MTRHFRLLAWLRWKYLWRASGRSRQVGAVLTVIVATGFAAFLLITSSISLHQFFTNPRFRESAWEFVHLGFVFLYLFWLYSGSFNDLYDPARLAPFPLPPRTLFFGSTLASFIGVTTIIGGALLAGFTLGIPGSLAEKLTRSVLFAFLLLHLQMLSRLIRLTFLAVLTSRRWRDMAVVISTLIGGGFYVASQLLPREGEKVMKAIEDFAAAGGPSTWFAWCPAVWLSWAYELKGARSLAGFGAFAILTLLIHRAGGRAEERLAFSEPIFHYRRRRKAATGRESFLGSATRLMSRIAGPVAAAVARKEFSIFFRDPAVRHRVLSSVIYIFVPFTMLFIVRGEHGAKAVEFAGFILLLAEMFFLTNLFGLEGTAIRNLLWFPASRRDVLLGKNLAYFMLFLPFNLVVLGGLGAAMGSPHVASGLVVHVASLLIVIALGNVTSVLFPQPFLAPGQRMTRRDDVGCLSVAARSLLYLLTLALLAPVLAASMLLENSSWAVASGVLGLAYATSLYFIGLRISERALLRREEQLGDYFRAA